MKGEKWQDALSGLTIILGIIALSLVIQASFDSSTVTGHISAETEGGSAGESITPSESNIISSESASQTSSSLGTTTASTESPSGVSARTPAIKHATVTTGSAGSSPETTSSSEKNTQEKTQRESQNEVQQQTPSTTTETASRAPPSGGATNEQTTQQKQTTTPQTPPTTAEVAARVSNAYDLQVSEVVEGTTPGENSVVRGYREAKIFGVFPVKMPVEVQVTIEANEPTITNVEYPWWAWAARTSQR